MKKILPIIVILLALLTLGAILFYFSPAASKIKKTRVNLANNYTSDERNPVWVNEIINGTKTYERWDQYEETVSKCSYRGELVYYVTYSGDDLYNDLISIDGTKICSPTGGFAGNGDGQCTDFSVTQNSCQLVWKK